MIVIDDESDDAGGDGAVVSTGVLVALGSQTHSSKSAMRANFGA